MANVTYLLGAGASYNALPVVNQFTDAIVDTIKALRDIATSNTIIASDQLELLKTGKEKIKLAIADLEQLKKGCENHLSIDTFAKMLYLTRNNDYNKIKDSITLFFELYGLLVSNENGHVRRLNKSKLDLRYDAFLAAILQDRYNNFPKNIRIITYNYDNQFIETYERYLRYAATPNNSIYELNLYSRGENIRKFDTNTFSIFKINGTFGFFNKNSSIAKFDVEAHPLGPVFGCVDKYLACNRDSSYKSALSFAWEAEPEEDEFIINTRRATTLTNILVVIGYSFPFFNRGIDECIFKKDSMQQLEKIYVQDENADEIIERIKALRFHSDEPNLKYIPVYKTHQFYLPNEL